MKANESIANYDIKVREYTNYAIKSIKNVCKNFGPRPVGSEAEKQAQEYMLQDLEKWCDTATRQEYKCSDKAFMSWVPIGATLLMLNVICFTLGLSVIGLVFAALALFFVVAEFIFYKPVLDVFFPKKTSGNVYGVIKSKGETKKRIILSGHTDSAFEWTYTYKGGRPVVATIIVVAVISILLGIGANIYGMIYFGAPFGSVVWGADGNLALRILAIVMYLTVPVLVMALKFCDYKRPVVGANDDLTGCFISCAAAKFLHDNNIRFENTEVAVLCAGGEEAGLRGAKAFAKENADILHQDGVETIFVGFDTIRELDFIDIYEKDMTGMVKNDRRVAELIQSACKEVGYDNVHIGTIALGSTDAAAMSQAKIPASSIVAMDPTPARYYHTRLDDADNLSAQAIDFGVKVALETVFLYDEKGI